MIASNIRENVKRILAELPPDVRLLAAAKGSTPQEILEAVDAGAQLIGENYVQEAALTYETIGRRAEWHYIGHLQKNKVKRAVGLFDVVETVDSSEIAREIDRRSAEIGKVIPIFIEINSGREPQKSGVFPENVEALIREIASLPNLKVSGLMTMGPVSDNPEDVRPCFTETRKVFERIRNLNLPNVEMKHLSMGMSNSYRIAVEEGANIVRIGTLIFGARE
ncbi:MAG: YggS family pyridoxal phosphate-dependent enzyme [Dehalococcoidales bacterium]|nr:YggS family pyridoxal phosphate-dependent enzyme [Dehalococcoidales bacterium]